MAILRPVGSYLWHFDDSVNSVDGVQPNLPATYILEPSKGKFNGGVQAETLDYSINITGSYTMAAYLNIFKWSDVLDVTTTWTDLLG